MDLDQIAPYAAPGSLMQNRPSQPLPQTTEQRKKKSANPYDNVADRRDEEEHRYLNIDEIQSSCGYFSPVALGQHSGS